MRLIYLCFSLLFSLSSKANPIWSLEHGSTSLSNYFVNNKKLSISFGKGELPTDGWRERYRRLKEKGEKIENYPFQWKLVELDSGKTLSQSKTLNKLFYGASTTKIMVGSAFLQTIDDPYSSKYFQDLLNMIVVSSNPAWRTVQYATGGDNMERGRLEVHSFTQNLGLTRTRAFWGYSSTMNGLHGNEINVSEFTEFMQKLYRGEFYGSELIFKIMLAGQKGYDMAKRFLPTNVMIANKGGRYDGPTTNPDTGRRTNPDGSNFTVRVRHQALILRYNQKDYSMVIFSDLGKEIDLSVMAYGLFKEYIITQ